MLDAAKQSERAERRGCKKSAKKSRRAGPTDRTCLHASPAGTAPKAHSATYWHRDLPPFDAEPIDEHTIEAVSKRVPHTMAFADELWNQCYEELMLQAGRRLEQELARLKGDYAHVLDEHVESKYDGAKGESWLLGRFRYVLYRQPVRPPMQPKTQGI
jgi:hypothetical protein